MHTDSASAQQTVQQLTNPPPAGTGFCSVDGNVTISNSQGSILSGLTGVSIQDASGTLQLDSMADESGQYSVLLPLGLPGIDYSTLMLSAYDPIQDSILNTLPLNASSFAPGQTDAGPTPNGTCSDSDAGSPDADDPDCD